MIKNKFNAMDAHNTLEIPDAEVTDQVIQAIRIGMDSIMKMMNDTIPRCPSDDEEIKATVTDKLESSLLQLVEAELIYSQTSSIVNGVVDELNLQDNPDMDTKEFLDTVTSISDMANDRIGDYRKTLTQDVLRSHPTFLKMRTDMETLLAEGNRSELDRLEDVETEPDEVDLEDVDEDDDLEVIPELDPISKQPLTDPVRNKICRHIYGRAAMVQLIKKNSRLRCPAMGCTNNKFVKVKDLIKDPELTARVLGNDGESSSSAPPTPQPVAPKAKGKKGKRGRRR